MFSPEFFKSECNIVTRWSDDPGAWCYPIGFGNHTFTYFNRNYTRAKICYGSLVFTDTARILLARDSCQSPMLDYDALFPFHYVAEYGNVVAHHRIETGKIARREVDKLMRSIRGHSSRKFEAAWAFVVTWDIKAWEYDLEATVQAVLFCDEQTVIPFCYAIYSYGDQTKIQAFNGIEQRVGGVGWTRGPNDRLQNYLSLSCHKAKIFGLKRKQFESQPWLAFRFPHGIPSKNPYKVLRISSKTQFTVF